MSKKKFVILGCGVYYEKMFETYGMEVNYQYNNDNFAKKSKDHKILLLISRMGNSKKVRKIAPDLAKWCRKYCYRFEIDEKSVDNKPIFIILQNNQYAHNEEFIEYMKCRFRDGVFIFWLTNTLKMIPEDIEEIKILYDHVLTFSRKDSREKGLLYHDWCFRRVITNADYESDLYFCGSDKGRGKQLVEIFVYLSKMGINCDFTITFPNEDTPVINGIKYVDEIVEYSKVFEGMKKSKCILEVLPEQAEGASTLRVAEAIALSKKLLTNNKLKNRKDIFECGQARIFDSVTDIDCDWILHDNMCSFLSGDVISPEDFLDDIYKQIEAK